MVVKARNDARKNISKIGSIKGELQDSDAKTFLAGNTHYDQLKVATDWGQEGIYLLGARSFSIWDADALLETSDLSPVYDSGSDFEVITGQRVPEFYNVSNSNVKLDWTTAAARKNRYIEPKTRQ